MKHRKLRIAWSVAWGIVAVLLIGLWVRSYSQHYGVWTRYSNTPDKSMHVYVRRGRLTLETRYNTGIASFYYEHGQLSDGEATDDDGRSPSGHRFQILHWHGRPYYIIPLWSLCSFCGCAIGFTWVDRANRFSLRTLLTATTLIAVALGLIVWATK